MIGSKEPSPQRSDSIPYTQIQQNKAVSNQQSILSATKSPNKNDQKQKNEPLSQKTSIQDEFLNTEFSEVSSIEIQAQTMPFEYEQQVSKSNTPNPISISSSTTGQSKKQIPIKNEHTTEIWARIQRQKHVLENSTDQQLLEYFKSYEPHHEEIIDIDGLLDSEHVQLKRKMNSVYLGEFVNGQRSGQGIMLYNSGGSYEGTWKDNLRSGRGFELFSQGNRYEGYYLNGKLDGVGTYVWITGEIYNGEWIEGVRQGSGQWRSNSNDVYIGEWKAGKADGYGVKTMGNGDVYEGQFKAGLKHGEGVEKFTRGDSYVGQYAHDKQEGEGEFTWSSGQTYKGYFKNGQKHGSGLWRKSKDDLNCDRFEGNFVGDKKNGFGVFKWASGNEYRGNYVDDLRHGYGELYWIDGTVYKGQWEKGKQTDGNLYQNGIEIDKDQKIQDNKIGQDQKEISKNRREVKQANELNPINSPKKRVETDYGNNLQGTPVRQQLIKIDSLSSNKLENNQQQEIHKKLSSKTHNFFISNRTNLSEMMYSSPVKQSEGIKLIRPSAERNSILKFDQLQQNEPKSSLILPPIKGTESSINSGDRKLRNSYLQTETPTSSSRRIQNRGRTPSVIEKQRNSIDYSYSNNLTEASKRVQEQDSFQQTTEYVQTDSRDPKNETCHKKYQSFQMTTSKIGSYLQVPLASPGQKNYSQMPTQQVSPYVSDKIMNLKGSNPFFMNNLSPLLSRLQRDRSSSYQDFEDNNSISRSVLSNRNDSSARKSQPNPIYWSSQSQPQSLSPSRNNNSYVNTTEKATCTRDFDDLPAYSKGETSSTFSDLPFLPQIDEKRKRSPSSKLYDDRPLNQHELILWEKYRIKHRIPSKPYENIDDPKVIAKIRAFLYPPIWKPPGIGFSPEQSKQKEIIDQRETNGRKSKSPSPNRKRNQSPYI